MPDAAVEELRATVARLTAEVAGLRAYIDRMTGQPVTLCTVCRQPVWPILSLYQKAGLQPDGSEVAFGHRGCLDGPGWPPPGQRVSP